MLDMITLVCDRRFTMSAVPALFIWLIMSAPAIATLTATDHSAPPLHIAEAFNLQTPADGSYWDTANGITMDQIAGNIPGNVLFPGETLKATFQLQNGASFPITGGTLEVRRYQLSTVGDNIFSYEIHNLGVVAHIPLVVEAPAGRTVQVACPVPVPALFGGYALIADLGPQGGRHLVGLCIRTFKSEADPQPYPVMTLDERDHGFLERIGIHAVRIGIAYKPTTDLGFAAYLTQIEANMADLKAHGITCMGLFGGGSNYEALGMWGHQLNDQAQMAAGSPVDTMWTPSYDADFTKFVALISRQEGWPRGPLTAVCLYNEPWEGGGVSGWLDDMPRYREGYQAMAAGVIQARQSDHVQVLIGGTDSTTNALDKLFGDGKSTFLPIFDFSSMHYQGLDSYTTFPLWRDRKGPQGRVRFWDTESWAANTDDRIAGQLAAWRAAGYDRLMGVDANQTVETNPVTLLNPDSSPQKNPDGSSKTVTLAQASSVAAAEAATAHFLGDRPFRRILFTNGLPWVFVFDGLPGRSNPEDGTVVVIGDVLSGNRTRFRTVDSLSGAARRAGLHRALTALAPGDPASQAVQLQLEAHDQIDGASLSLPASDHYSLYDFYGNPLKAANGEITVPLNGQGYFLRGDGRPGSFARLITALRSSRITGLEPVEVIAHDMTAPIGAHPTLRLSITNVLNRPVNGQLEAGLKGCVLSPAAQTLSIGPNETRQVALIVSGAPAPNNLYALHVLFDAGKDGSVTHDETMRCDVIAHRTITVDGDLSDWSGVLPQQVSAGNTAPSLMEQAWYPGKSFDTTGGGGLAVAYLAYDNKYFYFASKVADTTPDPGTLRFATRDDDAFFYPQTVYVADGNGTFRTVQWPQGLRRYTYRKSPVLPAGNTLGSDTDNIQIGFNAIPEDDVADKGMYSYPPGTMPHYIGFKDTDYEFALNKVAPQYGGGTETWRLATPGMPYKMFYPRQPKSPFDGPVTGGKLVVERVGNTRITEAAIPWSELAWVKKRLSEGETVKFSFRVNDNNGPEYELAHDRSVSQENAETFHNPWAGNHWSNEVEFGFAK